MDSTTAQGRAVQVRSTGGRTFEVRELSRERKPSTPQAAWTQEVEKRRTRAAAIMSLLRAMNAG